MQHLASIEHSATAKSLHVKATGRFYTPEAIGRPLASTMAEVAHVQGSMSVIDPFCGDGRLVAWLLEAMASRGIEPAWSIELWDIDAQAVTAAVARVTATAEALHVAATIRSYTGDSFSRGVHEQQRFDMLVTNPPWERLKPDRRESGELQVGAAERYVDDLRAFDRRLSSWFPLSRPMHKFSGWGTNLARVGTELSMRLVRAGGVIGVVSPPSLFADQDSLSLRQQLLSTFSLQSVSYFPAEARLFEGVDQPAITFVAVHETPQSSSSTGVIAYDDRGLESYVTRLPLRSAELERTGYCLPIGFGLQAADLLPSMRATDPLCALEGRQEHQLWAGRELDETGYRTFVSDSGSHRFVKGRMVERWKHGDPPDMFVDSSAKRVPPSANHLRIAWRDVSRPNQKRRMQAALIPAGWVTGNSLNVAYFRNDDRNRLLALLALMNSLVFEFQVRTRLSTNHVSLTTVREVSLPSMHDASVVNELARLAARRVAGDVSVENELEVRCARLYGLDVDSFSRMVACFPKITEREAQSLAASWREMPDGQPVGSTYAA
jgi:Alw26I/Eco31I/Esp3I family type II restriction m6 adenine DNA methyltransferase